MKKVKSEVKAEVKAEVKSEVKTYVPKFWDKYWDGTPQTIEIPVSARNIKTPALKVYDKWYEKGYRILAEKIVTSEEMKDNYAELEEKAKKEFDKNTEVFIHKFHKGGLTGHNYYHIWGKVATA